MESQKTSVIGQKKTERGKRQPIESRQEARTIMEGNFLRKQGIRGKKNGASQRKKKTNLTEDPEGGGLESTTSTEIGLKEETTMNEVPMKFACTKKKRKSTKHKTEDLQEKTITLC